MPTKPNQDTADVILRSADESSFYTWKIFLSISSPVFGDMFTLPQPHSLDNGLPVIDLQEDSSTLGHILSLCHPPGCTGRQFKVGSIEELRLVIEATMKYDMENARRVALGELTNPSILRQDPMVVYALACQHECPEAARLAAKYTLALPFFMRGYVPDLEKIHAGKLCRLLLYREACGTAASSLAVDHTWIVYTDLLPLFKCDASVGDESLDWTAVRNPPSRKYRTGRVESKLVHKWWLEYMKRSKDVLQRRPHGDAVKDKQLVDDALWAISTSNCKHCKESQVSETFRSFVHIFAENIERRIAEIEISLEF